MTKERQKIIEQLLQMSEDDVAYIAGSCLTIIAWNLTLKHN